ncbi:MAG: succinate dehydrogenase iron-sulfur subunit [Pseudonocardiaceae bacterium]
MSNKVDDITVEVARYRPEQEGKPTTQTYRVPSREGWTVLDGLNYIKDHLDGTLSYRWSCRMGICGSCGMTINGEPRLACATFLVDYAPKPVRVAPLSNFPVVRDLVVDIADFMHKLVTVTPWVVRDDDLQPPDHEYLQTPAEMAKYQQYNMCINCMLCYSACPSYAVNPVFIGPAAIAIAQRYNLDSRDHGALARTDVLTATDGVWQCSLVGECSAVCPKGVDPVSAIQRYKLTAAIESLKSVLWPRGDR